MKKIYYNNINIMKKYKKNIKTKKKYKKNIKTKKKYKKNIKTKKKYKKNIKIKGGTNEVDFNKINIRDGSFYYDNYILQNKEIEGLTRLYNNKLYELYNEEQNIHLILKLLNNYEDKQELEILNYFLTNTDLKDYDIVKFIYFYDYESNIGYLIMEKMQGNLSDFITENNKKKIEIIINIVNRLKSLNEKNIIYSDLKLDNIFYNIVDDQIIIKFGDLGGLCIPGDVDAHIETSILNDILCNQTDQYRLLAILLSELFENIKYYRGTFYDGDKNFKLTLLLNKIYENKENEYNHEKIIEEFNKLLMWYDNPNISNYNLEESDNPGISNDNLEESDKRKRSEYDSYS
jgi:serine/threonine protein kinase